jgi:tetratricopeptide (TPR) repeat protein
VLLFGALAVTTLVAYTPALDGTLLWDDAQHLTAPALQSLPGLWRIWFDLGATQQYYPLLHSAFWLQHQLWGSATTGYHVVNVLLHASSSFLIFLIVRRLASPAVAALTAFLFALHPVQVESVAWITELKNTLSGAFYFGAALAWLRYREHRLAGRYAIVVLLFVAALVSKSVTATLPAALLVVVWWTDRRVSVRDLMSLAPMFVLGAAAGAFTAWYEHTGIGAQGAEFAFTFVERGLIAGRAVWFYLWSLVWPVNLAFVYRRWDVSQGVWWQYLFPLGMLLLLGVLWTLRTRSAAARAALAALLVYGVTLGPALGFVNVYPFRFSFVADHFQYHASVAMLALASAGLVRLAGARAHVAGAALVVVLAVLTWQQSASYGSAVRLYRDTISRTPSAWLAHGNLAAELVNGSPADVEEARRHAGIALQLRPDFTEARYNLAGAQARLGNHAAAVAEYERVLTEVTSTGGFAARLPRIYWSLGRSLQALGRTDDAMARYRLALQLAPDFAAAHRDLGTALGSAQRHEEALEHFREAVRLEPNVADNHLNAGLALLGLRRPSEAVPHLEAALRLDPSNAAAREYLGAARRMIGRD